MESSDSEDPEDSEDDTQLFRNGRLYRIYAVTLHSYEVIFVPDTDSECVTVQSKYRIQVYLLYFVGGGWGGG